MHSVDDVWSKVVGQNSVREHDAVSSIYPSDKKINRDMSEAVPEDYYDFVNGQTGFMREAKFYSELLRYLGQLPQERIDVLVVAGSVGCEAYSAAILKHMMGIEKDIVFHSSDISKVYTDVAKHAVYPKDWVLPHGEKLSPYFNAIVDGDGFVVCQDIQDSVVIRDAEDVRDISAVHQFDVVVAMNFLMHVVTSTAHYYGFDEFDRMIAEYANKNDLSRNEARKIIDVPFLDHVDPILTSICSLSRHLVCVNRLEDTPYWHSNRKAERDIFADNGFSLTMNAEWGVCPSSDLEDNSQAGEYSRSRDYTQVFVRG